MDPKVAKLHTIKFNSGTTAIGIRRQQEGMKVIHKIEDPTILKQLKELSSSYL
jgi:hypothetical protein